MKGSVIILLGVAIFACAKARSTHEIGPSRFPHLKGWQKILGILAVVLAMLIILNPDFLALGVLGDTAFFDMLVLALSVQLSMFAARAFRISSGIFFKQVLGLRFALALLAPVFAGMVALFQKAAHRILS